MKDSPWSQAARLRPLTPEEHAQVATIEGMKRMLLKHAQVDIFTGSLVVFARANNLNDEDMFALMAYHAIIYKEEFFEQLRKAMELALPPTFIIKADPKT